MGSLSRNQISPGQLRFWLLLAMVGPLAHEAGVGYMAITLAAAAILPLNLLQRDGFSGMGKAMAWIQWIWVAVFLADTLPGAGLYWPGERSETVVPLALLALAGLPRGKKQSAGVACVLFWATSLMLAGLAALSVGAIEPDWLAPMLGPWDGGLTAVLLLPGIVSAAEPIRKGRNPLVMGIGILALTLAVLLQGTLGLPVAARVSAPLFELGRSVENGGMELLAAVSMTLSWYGFSSLVTETGVSFGLKCGIQEKKGRIITVIFAGILVIFGLKIPAAALSAGCLLLWIFVPLLRCKNNFKKIEKSS